MGSINIKDTTKNKVIMSFNKDEASTIHNIKALVIRNRHLKIPNTRVMKMMNIRAEARVRVNTSQRKKLVS